MTIRDKLIEDINKKIRFGPYDSADAFIEHLEKTCPMCDEKLEIMVGDLADTLLNKYEIKERE